MGKLLQMIKFYFNILVIFLSFKKNDISGNKKFLIYLIIKTTCLGSIWIPQENASSNSSTKFVSFLLWYEGITSGTKKSEMPIRRNMAKPQFMWSRVFNSMRSDGFLFLKYVAHTTASPQNISFTFLKNIIYLSILINVLFIISATLFCWGL